MRNLSSLSRESLEVSGVLYPLLESKFRLDRYLGRETR